jgi:hypothetical protein
VGHAHQAELKPISRLKLSRSVLSAIDGTRSSGRLMPEHYDMHIDELLRPGVSIDPAQTRLHAETIATLIAAPVTRARLCDRDEILEVCKEDWRENSCFSLSEEKLERKIDDILEKGEGVVGIIRRSEIEAIMIMQISQSWNSTDFCLEELLNFVRPQYRRSTNAKDMIQFAKRCSDELDIPLVIGVVSNERTAAKIQLYERQLGKSCGGVFMYSRNSQTASA